MAGQRAAPILPALRTTNTENSYTSSERSPLLRKNTQASFVDTPEVREYETYEGSQSSCDGEEEGGGREVDVWVPGKSTFSQTVS